MAPYKIPFGPRGLAWFRKQDFGPIENLVRDQLLEQLEHYAKQVGAYAGLTCRVHQSGSHCYHGSITHEGSSWLRWVLVQVAMHVVRDDVALRNFYTRIRKRSSAKIARVATARKLAEICWKRLSRWHKQDRRKAA